MIDNPDEVCLHRTRDVGRINGEVLPHLLVGVERRGGKLIPKRWRILWRCLYCGERAR